MSSLVSTFGLDWKLLLAQGINFFVLLFVLRYFAYRPLLNILAERKKRVEAGLQMAEEAETRLGAVNLVVKDKLKDADAQAIALLRDTQEKAKVLEAQLAEKAHEQSVVILKNAEMLAIAKGEEAQKELEQEARILVRQAIAKTVELSPEKIDEALIKRALRQLQRTS